MPFSCRNALSAGRDALRHAVPLELLVNGDELWKLSYQVGSAGAEERHNVSCLEALVAASSMWTLVPETPAQPSAPGTVFQIRLGCGVEHSIGFENLANGILNTAVVHGGALRPRFIKELVKHFLSPFISQFREARLDRQAPRSAGERLLRILMYFTIQLVNLSIGYGE